MRRGFPRAGSSARWALARQPLALTCALAFPRASVAQLPSTVTVTGLDYAFQAPDTVGAGLAIVAFVNRGTVRHEMFLLRLQVGTDAPQHLSLGMATTVHAK